MPERLRRKGAFSTTLMNVAAEDAAPDLARVGAVLEEAFGLPAAQAKPDVRREVRAACSRSRKLGCTWLGACMFAQICGYIICRRGSALLGDLVSQACSRTFVGILQVRERVAGCQACKQASDQGLQVQQACCAGRGAGAAGVRAGAGAQRAAHRRHARRHPAPLAPRPVRAALTIHVGENWRACQHGHIRADAVL